LFFRLERFSGSIWIPKAPKAEAYGEDQVHDLAANKKPAQFDRFDFCANFNVAAEPNRAKAAYAAFVNSAGGSGAPVISAPWSANFPVIQSLSCTLAGMPRFRRLFPPDALNVRARGRLPLQSKGRFWLLI
jgi:hypothetical protein